MHNYGWTYFYKTYQKVVTLPKYNFFNLNYFIFADYHDCVPKIEPLDPDAIHVPTLQSQSTVVVGEAVATPTVGHKIILHQSPLTSSSPLAGNNSYSPAAEDDSNVAAVNLSNSLDVEMGDVTMDES